MVNAQIRMETPTLMALMIMAGLIGFSMDRVFLLASKYLIRWRTPDAA
jgi:ABC-type nitrate/sulfonate/bicarbonate transport system permease component